MTKIIGPDMEPAIDTSARDAALENVDGGCPVDVKYILRVALQEVARNQPRFNSDDVFRAASMTPREPRVMGPVMLWGRKQGFCRPLSSRKTGHRTSHNRPKTVWQSQIYKGIS